MWTVDAGLKNCGDADRHDLLGAKIYGFDNDNASGIKIFFNSVQTVASPPSSLSGRPVVQGGGSALMRFHFFSLLAPIMTCVLLFGATASLTETQSVVLPMVKQVGEMEYTIPIIAPPRRNFTNIFQRYLSVNL